LFLGIWALPSSAAAVPVSCPDPAVDDQLQFSAEGTGTTTVEECVSGDGNLNQVGDIGDAFGGDVDEWTSFCNSDEDCDEAYGFTWGDGTWSFTGSADEEYALGIKDGTAPGNVGDTWAIFLLSNTDQTGDVLYSGTWDISLNGETNYDRLSHFVIFDRDSGVETTTTDVPTTTTDVPTTTTENIPEPTILTLLGAGLVLASRRLRRQTT